MRSSDSFIQSIIHFLSLTSLIAVLTYSQNSFSQFNFFHGLINLDCNWGLKKDSNYVYSKNIFEFAKKATSKCAGKDFSGYYNIKYDNNTIINTQYIERNGGTTISDLNFCDNNMDSGMCIVRFKGDLNLNTKITTAVRKKGLVIYVDGNLTIGTSGSISMTAKGAIGDGQDINIIQGYSIPALGALGGTGFPGSAKDGHTDQKKPGTSDNSLAIAGKHGYNGATGGGAGGGGRSYGWQLAKGGNGGRGTSYSGGTGGGGATSRSVSRTGGNGSDNGGLPGCASGGWDWMAHAGVGNIPSTIFTYTGKCNGDNYESKNNNFGTGGLLIVFVNGNIQNNGSITARGVDSANDGGGSSGGGSVNIFYSGMYSGSGFIDARGGNGGPEDIYYSWQPAGSGTTRAIKIFFEQLL